MASHEDDDLLDDDETTPFAANAENKLLDKEVCLRGCLGDSDCYKGQSC